MANQRDVEYMSHALRLARRGINTTHPNPNVGCVIVNAHNDIVGQGYHSRAGQAHAEIHALQQAGESAQGSTVYVTLEPCCHEGKTGPCTQALINAGVKKVFVAMRDPNPLVAGNGIEALKQQGIEIDEGILQTQAQQLNRGFIKRMTQRMPWITAKVASSMDGRTALNNGVSKWITSEHARHDVQTLRARHAAILTGIGTVLADNPSLNVRLNSLQSGNNTDSGIAEHTMQPLRVIIDPKLDMPEDAKLLGLPGNTLVFTAVDVHDHALNRVANCELIQLASQQGHFDLREVFAHLAAREINSVLIESGASLLGSLLKAELVDELIHYIAPTLMGNDARGMFALPELTRMDDCITLRHQDVRQIGPDIRITSLINY